MKYDLNLDEPTHRMFAAPTRRGKSYFVGACVEQLYEQEHPFIIFDTKTSNHIGLKELKKVKVLKILPNAEYDIERLMEYDYVLCVPGRIDIDIDDILNVYRKILGYMWIREGERFFIAEEAHNWSKNASAPDKLFERVAREGAGNQKYMWWITQRLQNFSQLLWGQCGYTYLWRFNTPTDVRYAAQIIPEFDWRKDAEGRKIRGLNYDLGDHDVLVWDGRGYDIIPAAAVTRKTKHRG